MIIGKIKNNEDFVFGLVAGFSFGLAIGLVFGLAIGLVFGLGYGLAIGLVFGLVFGLAIGLAIGLAGGLGYYLAFGFLFPLITGTGLSSYVPVCIIGIIGFIALEIIFWLDREKKKPCESRIWFTIKKKLEALFDVITGISIANIITYITEAICQNTEAVLEVLKWTGIVIGIIGAIAVYILLNSIKYRSKKK